jgi:hypothetical protein
MKLGTGPYFGGKSEPVPEFFAYLSIKFWAVHSLPRLFAASRIPDSKPGPIVLINVNECVIARPVRKPIMAEKEFSEYPNHA